MLESLIVNKAAILAERTAKPTPIHYRKWYGKQMQRKGGSSASARNSGTSEDGETWWEREAVRLLAS